MANKRYWLKVKENFFDDDEIVFLKSQKNGYEYIYLWMRLLLKCLRSNEETNCGFLRINDKVPYDINMLSNLFGMNIDVVRTGIEIFKQMGMLDILDDGTYYIEAVQKMIGKEGESAERMRIHREKKQQLQIAQSDNGVTEKCDNIIRVEKEKDESFEIFWKLYDKKRNRKVTENLWKKVNPELHDFIYKHIEQYKKVQPEKLYRKDPERYLKYECWNDEVIQKEDKQQSQPKQQKPSDNYKNIPII